MQGGARCKIECDCCWSGCCFLARSESRLSSRRSFPRRHPPPRTASTRRAWIQETTCTSLGQGPRRPDGTLPATFAAQVQQALDNIKAVVQTAGLTMEHVVYTQVYLEEISKYGEMNRVFTQVFAKTPPARAVLGVAKLPYSSIQITAVAVRNLAERQAGPSAGLQIQESQLRPYPHP